MGYVVINASKEGTGTLEEVHQTFFQVLPEYKPKTREQLQQERDINIINRYRKLIPDYRKP